MKRGLSVLLALLLTLSPLTGALANTPPAEYEMIAGTSKEHFFSFVTMNTDSSPMITLGEVVSSNTNAATGKMIIAQQGNTYNIGVRIYAHAEGVAKLECSYSTMSGPKKDYVFVLVKDGLPESLPLEVSIDQMPSVIKLKETDKGLSVTDDLAWKAAEVGVSAFGGVVGGAIGGRVGGVAGAVLGTAGGPALAVVGYFIGTAVGTTVGAAAGATVGKFLSTAIEVASFGVDAYRSQIKTVYTDPNPIKLKLSIYNPNTFEVKGAGILIASEKQKLGIGSKLMGKTYEGRLGNIPSKGTITHTVTVYPEYVYNRGEYTDSLSISPWYVDAKGKNVVQIKLTSPIQVVSYLDSKEIYERFKVGSDPVKSVSIHCPVDVHILDAAGTLIGTLSKEGDMVQAEGLGGYVSGESKLLSISADKLSAYTLRLEATDDGTMTVNAMDGKADGSIGMTLFGEVPLHKGDVLSTDITDTEITRLYAADGTEIAPDYVLNRETMLAYLEEHTDVTEENREAVCDAILLGLVTKDFVPDFQMDYASLWSHLFTYSDLSEQRIEEASYSLLLAIMDGSVALIQADSGTVMAQFAEYSVVSQQEAEAVLDAVRLGIEDGTIAQDALPTRGALAAYLGQHTDVSPEAIETVCDAAELGLVKVGSMTDKASEETTEPDFMLDQEYFWSYLAQNQRLAQKDMQAVCFTVQLGLITGMLTPEYMLDRAAVMESMTRYWEMSEADMEAACDAILLGLATEQIAVTQSFQQTVTMGEFVRSLIGLAELYMREERGATMAAVMGEERAGEAVPDELAIETAVSIGMLPESVWAERAYSGEELNAMNGAWALLGCVDLLTDTDHLSQCADDEEALSAAKALGLIGDKGSEAWMYRQPFSYEEAVTTLYRLWQKLDAVQMQ